MKKKIDWIEEQAALNLNYRLQITETLAKEANNLLLILIAALSAIMAYVINNAEQGGNQALLAGAVAVTVWLMFVAFLLVFKCIMTNKIMPPGNEPKNLNLADYALDKIQGFELINVQNKINYNASRNRKTAYWLDKARLLTIASPFIFILAWGLSGCL